MSDFFIPGSFVIYSPLASPPASPRTGWLWLVTDSANRRLRYYDGSAWQDLYVDPTWAPGFGTGYTPASAEISRSTALSTAGDGTAYTVTFDTSDYDEGSYVNIGSHPTRLTITNAGVYLFTAHVIWASNNAFWRSLHFELNGSLVFGEEFGAAPNGVQAELQVPAQKQLAAADYVELVIQQGSGSTLNASGLLMTVTRVS